MAKLALLIYVIVAPTIAGILVTIALAAPNLGLDGLGKLWIVAITGFVIAIVPSIWLGKTLDRAFNNNKTA